MELNELLETVRAVPTWVQFASAGYAAYVFLTGNASLFRRAWQGAAWTVAKVAAWCRQPSRMTVTEANVELMRLQMGCLLEALGEGKK